MTKTWTKAEALPILQQAYRDKILSAQNGGQECLYRSDAGPCIIGVLLDDQTAKRWDQIGSAGSVALRAVVNGGEKDEVVKSIVRSTFGNDLEWFAGLQFAHDSAINSTATADQYLKEIEVMLELR